ncbi:MAG: hypothetical protein RMK99_17215 [Anaerolineales bacterium]|nr:hypothetical protein [Anaerolineales bacterium]
MLPEAEERVDRLEVALEQFITETRAQMREVNAALLRLERSSERDRREYNKRWGDLANKMGTLVEDIVAPSLRRIALEDFGFGAIDFFAARLEKRHPVTGQAREFDVVVAGPHAVLLNETKSAPTLEHAETFVRFVRSDQFFEYFPEYRGRRLKPVFSSLFLPESLVTYLTGQGIYAVAMGDEVMQVLNLKEVSEQSR